MPVKTTEQTEQAQKQRYLKAVEQIGTLTAGCRAARVSPHTVYQWREFDVEFSVLEQEAKNRCADELEATVIRRAKRRSDLLAMFMLKAMRPEKYRERFDVTTAGQPMLKEVGADAAAVL
jgi:hypothetical protein